MQSQSFPQTRWSVVLSAKRGEADASFAALEALALAYWRPIYAWLRGQGRSHEEAQDDAQGFFDQRVAHAGQGLIDRAVAVAIDQR